MKNSVLIFIYSMLLNGCANQEMIKCPFQPGQTFHFSEDVQMNFEKRGDQGPAVIFLHGFGASLATWNEITNAFPPEEYQLYFMDLKGFGYSSKPNDGKYSVLDQANIITQFITKHNLRHVILVGHSYGGGVALLTYLNFRASPDNPVEKMVLIDSAGYTQKLPFFVEYLKTPVVNFLILNFVPREMRAEQTLKKAFYDKSKVTEDKIHQYSQFFDMPGSHNSFVQTAKQVLPKNYKAIINQFKLVEVPTLIIWGRNDSIMPLGDAYKFQSDIRNSVVRVVEDCGHIPQEEKPEETAKLIIEFLQGV